VDDAWPLKAGQFADMVPLYDPHDLLPELRRVALAPSPEAVRSAIVQAFVDEPYELADLVTRGDLGDPEQVYACVETLWAGLLGWMADLGLAFARDDLPF